MPRVGKRILKSSLAVFICLLIYLLRRQEGMVFYSCIAAVLCIQQDTYHTIKAARQRVEGTLIGGLIGLLVLLFEKAFIPSSFLLAQYALISVMIIPIIYITVLLKKTAASYISCVVFMSVVIVHGTDVEPYIFTWNRMVDTLIGIGIAYLINCFHIPHRHDKLACYVVDLEQGLLNKEAKLSSYTGIKLTQLLERKVNIVIATNQLPGSFQSLLQGIPFTLPMILLHGIALYDINQQTYQIIHFIRNDVLLQLQQIFKRVQVNVFTFTVMNDVLHAYYEELQNPAEEMYYHAMRRIPFQNYLQASLPQNQEAFYLLLIQKDEAIRSIYKQIMEHTVQEGITMHLSENKDFRGYANLEIYSKQAEDKAALTSLMKQYGFASCHWFSKDKSNRPIIYKIEHEGENVVEDLTNSNRTRKDPAIRAIDHLLQRIKK